MHVYALGDPRTQQIRYIGIARDVYKRYAQHLNHPHTNDRKNAWMAEIKQAGIVPALTILESNVEEAIIHERERHWIHHYLTLNAPLTNIMHGTQPSYDGQRAMQNKQEYTLQELFERLPIPISRLAKESNINEVTLARIRDGECTRRDTVNKLLLTLSKIYERELSLDNVTGTNIRVNKRLERKETEKQQEMSRATPS
jgi:hypothetical protein